MYDAESNVSQPNATAKGIVKGCPAPKRCNGIEVGIFFFAAIIISANNLYSYDSINSTGLPNASIWYPILINSFVDLFTNSGCSLPWIGPIQICPLFFLFFIVVLQTLNVWSTYSFAIFFDNPNPVGLSRGIAKSVIMSISNFAIAGGLTSTSPYSKTWYPPESVIIELSYFIILWIPFSLALSSNLFIVMYAFVITTSNPISLIFFAGIDCLTGCITGTKAGVSIFPWFVWRTPILPAKSLYFISNNS